jgi:ABC-2 type transport system ATP-binding protein
MDNDLSTMAITVQGLKKNYGKNVALRGIDLEIRRGEIFALLGPNGAGKTTFVEILEGFRRRDAGEVSVLGIDPDHQPMTLKTRVGIVLQSTGMDRYLNVTETVSMYSSYYPHPRPVGEILALVGLEAKRDERVLRLSGGQQRRLDVAIALAGNPDLLFLDEPTTGFDPSARREVWDVIKNLRGLGKTVVLTTHFMDEAQYLADRLAVIANGRIVAQGNPETLAGRDRMLATVRFSLPLGTTLPPHLETIALSNNAFELKTVNVTKDLNELTSWALGAGVDLEDLRVERPTLEDVYLELTSKAQPTVSSEEES